jgi:hypothetical protein
MKVYWCKAGAHIHMRVFHNGAKMGALCCREEEFDIIRRAMIGADFEPEGEEMARLVGQLADRIFPRLQANGEE